MKCLVIGLGSMGKRRIRCLKALGYNDISGYDIRQDRRDEAKSKYMIHLIDDYYKTDLKGFNLIIISTPPDKHRNYAEDAISLQIPCFIEASVSLQDVIKIREQVKASPSFVAPSCTLKFHPAIKIIKQIVKAERFGAVTNFTYHCGQYLPDWHPWESIHEFYVSNRETGGAREIVPFELTWLTDIFGLPKIVKGFYAKTMEIGVNIEDTYAFSLKYDEFIGNVIVDVVSRFATRSLILNFERAQMRWNWEDNCIKLYDSSKKEWDIIEGFQGASEEGYNKNIIEEMYIQEVKSFIDATKNPELFPNNLKNDKRILEILNQIENSDGGFYK